MMLKLKKKYLWVILSICVWDTPIVYAAKPSSPAKMFNKLGRGIKKGANGIMTSAKSKLEDICNPTTLLKELEQMNQLLGKHLPAILLSAEAYNEQTNSLKKFYTALHDDLSKLQKKESATIPKTITIPKEVKEIESTLKRLKNQSSSKDISTFFQTCATMDKSVRKEKLVLAKFYEQEAEKLLKINETLGKNYHSALWGKAQHIGGPDLEEAEDDDDQDDVSSDPRLCVKIYNLMQKNTIQAQKFKEKAIRLYEEAFQMTPLEKQQIAVKQDHKAFIDMVQKELDARKSKQLPNHN